MKQKVKEFVNDHKKELIFGVTVITVGGAFALGRMYGIHICNKENLDKILGSGYVHNDRFKVGERLCVADLGKLGEALIQQDGHSPDTIIDGIELYMTVVDK